MYNLQKFRTKKVYISNSTPWAKIISPGMVINKDGSLMSIIRYRGPDLDSETPERLAVITAQFNDLLLTQLSSGYILNFEATREASTSYDKDVYFPDEITRKIDDERRKLFTDNSYNFESKYYLTIQYYPPTDMEKKIKDMVIENNVKKKEMNIEEYIHIFSTKIDSIISSMRRIGIPSSVMLANDIATYLHSCVSNKKHKVIINENVNQLIDNILFDTPLVAGFHPMLGKKHLKIVVPLTFPPTSFFGMFNDLNLLGFEYRWITRFIYMDKTDTLNALEGYSKGWKGKVVPLTKAVKELIRGRADFDGGINENALNKVEEVKNAKFSVGEDQILYGYYSTMIIIKNEDENIAENEANEVVQLFQNMGLTARIEDINAVDDYFASLPGNVYNNVRKPLISTGNLIHMMPITSVWAGDERNEHFKAPPLIYTKTIGNTPFRLNLHVGEVGHSMMIGPTGSGKSVHLCLIEAQFRKYKDAQVFIFDKGSSSKILTAGVGGNFYNLGSSDDRNTLSFQPLLRIDSLSERTWISEWLCDYLTQENITVTPKIKKTVWNALCDMCTYKGKDIHLRTMSTFTTTLQDEELREAFKPLTNEGAYGKIFDSSKENVEFSSWQAYEMGRLMEAKSIVGPTLMYLFHRIEESLDGRPTIIVLDECWVFFSNQSFANKIKEWLKVLRKYNASVIFATQSLDEVRNSSIFTTILDSCSSRIFLPNSKALSDENRELYHAIGLNDKKIEIIATAVPKRQYYYDSMQGSRLYELSLSKFALAYVSCNKTDLNKCDEILNTYGIDDFNKYWQEYKGL